MIRHMTLGIFLSLACLVAGAAENPVWECRNFSADSVVLKGGAVVKNGKLILNGENAFAEIPGSRDMQLTKSGMTLSLTVKLNDQGTKNGSADAHDMFFCKEGAFLFGRDGRRYYVNLHNGEKWCADMKGGKLPDAGEWIHLAVVFEYLNDKAQGNVGFLLRVYENGEPVCSRKFLWSEAAGKDLPIKLGCGFGGGPWLLNGEIGEAAVYDRALTPGEVADLFLKNKYTAKIPKGFTEIDPALAGRISEMKKRHDHPVVQWIIQALERGAATGYSQVKTGELLAQYEELADIQDIRKLQAEFNGKMKDLFLYVNPEIAALFYLGRGQGGYPLAGLYSMKSGRDIFGEQTISWKIRGQIDSSAFEISSNSPQVKWESRMDGESALKISWNCEGPLAFAADSRISFSGARMESDFKVSGIAGLLTEVNYPQYAFAQLKNGPDTMVYPYMFGVLVGNPTRESFKIQSGRYPSTQATMQFGAYYDRETGIYFGYEDGLARTKDYEVKGLRGNLRAEWTTPVPRGPEDKASGFCMNGKAVLELYQGEWYEAGAIYRRFLEREAAWWIPDLPRQDSPEWFRNNTITILAVMGSEDLVEQHRDISAYLRQYFELPLVLHWYSWDDYHRAAWPHFPIAGHTFRMNEQIRAAGVHTIPYIDDRLWKIKDGPNSTDLMYLSHGTKYAARNQDGSITTEKYLTWGECAVMCPAVKGWQNHLIKLTERLASYGFSGAYHDQVAASPPVLCFNPEHGHRLNDGAMWLEQGYWPIFREIRKKLKKSHPDFCHTTEENAEPYLKCFDGYLTWRTTYPDVVPLYISIYSGRVQFHGLTYNGDRRQGDAQSFFCKVARQLVYSEQLGHFILSELSLPDERRLFVKKAAHVRTAMLPSFNGGRMLAPIRYAVPPKESTSLWGGVQTDQVTRPVIESSAWMHPDGSVVYVFANSSPETETAELAERAECWICREGASEPVRSSDPVITMAPRSFEIRVFGSGEEAKRIQKTMQRLATFDYGKSAGMSIQYIPKKIDARSGELITVKDAAGNMGCALTKDRHHAGYIQNDALIFFDEVDFGPEGSDEIAVNVGVDPKYADGSILMVLTDPSGKESVVGQIKLRETGGFDVYQDQSFKLDRKLQGRQKVHFHFKGQAVCNFRGWKFF